MGIGESIVKKALQIYFELEPHEDILLHTQTWSYKAVKLYQKLGFVMLKTDTIKGCSNEYLEALKVLKDILPIENYLALANTAK